MHAFCFRFLGTAGDSLGYNRGLPFSTKDRDNDSHDRVNCASAHKGAWWYNRCAASNLNGRYLPGKFHSEGMFWYTWEKDYPYYCVPRSEMKTRQKDF